MDNRLYWIWLQQALGQGSPKAAPLLRVFSTPEGIWQADGRQLKEAGLSEKDCQKLADKSMDTAERILHKIVKSGGWVLTPDDALYPDSLRDLYDLPLVLYGLGEWPDWTELPALAMVGKRESTSYSMAMAEYLAAGVASAGITVVSGGAVGVDGASHRGALAVGGRTIVVQGCGLDVAYPRENIRLRKQVLKSHGAVISEFPLGTKGWKGNYPLRNRIISGLCYATCVVQADDKSGALITARHAREQGREVLAVPGPAGMPEYAGNNRLLRQGAALVETAEDILRLYRDRFGKWIPSSPKVKLTPPSFQTDQKPKLLRLKVAEEPAEKPAKTPTAKPVATPPENGFVACTVCPDFVSEDGKRMFALLEETPRPIDWLADNAGIPAAKAMAVLTELEIAGAARSYPGQQYSR